MEKDAKHNKDLSSESTVSVAWLITGVIITVVIIIIGVLIAKGSIGLTGTNLVVYKGKIISKDEAKTKAADYITNKFLQGKDQAEVSNVQDEGSLYKFTVKVKGQEFDSYISKDGKFLFPESYEIKEEDLNASKTATKTEIEKREKTTAYLFTMSFCPYGNIAEKAMKPVADLLGDKATIEPHYVIYSSSQGYEGSEYCLDEENKYCSMHGIKELNQDVRELCAFKYDGADKYWDFVEKVDNNCTSKNVDECWEEQATAAGLDVARIKTCKTDEATDLLANEVELNEKYGVTGSPTLIINDAKYEGGRTAEDYKDAICSGFTTEPEECNTELSADAQAAQGSCS